MPVTNSIVFEVLTPVGKKLLTGVFFGAGDANYFELQLDHLLAHFNRLMEAYQPEQKEDSDV